MNKAILDTLRRLEHRSKMENSRAVIVSPGQLMSAITWNTGQLFNIMLRSMGATRVMEIGTSTGFSTIWMAEALSERDGRIYTIEADVEKIQRARQNIQDAGVEALVKIMEGNALDVLSEMIKSGIYDSFYDFVLIDADKENVETYFETSLQMVRKGGIIAVDNMLYPERFSDIMNRFAEAIRQNPAVRSVTVPVGNGEEIAIKL